MTYGVRMIAKAAVDIARSPRRARIVVMATTAAVATSAAVLAPVFQPTANATTTYAVTATVGVGNEGSGGSIAVDSRTHRAYVTSHADNQVSVINTGTNAAAETITVGSGPVGVAIDTIPTHIVKEFAEPAIVPPTLQPVPTVFVANYGSKTISVIDSSTNTVVATVPIGDNLPQDLAVDTSSHTLYAAGVAGSTTGSVMSVVDGVHRTLSSTVPSDGFFQHVAVDASTHQVYAAGCCQQTLWELDGATDTSVANLTVPGTYAVATNPATHEVYVTNRDDTAGAVSVLDESTSLITATVPVGRYPDGVAVDTSANVIYVSNRSDNTVSVIDGATKTVIATVPAGLSPTAIAVDTATHTAYVIDAGSNTVSVITRTVTGSASRLSGSDRFGTAVAVSKAEFPTGGAGAIVLARGDDYPDALVGAPLAAAKNAPLLLTSGSSLPAAIKVEIQRVLAPGGTVYVLGGTSAVPTSIETELTGLGYQVIRYSGATRFATAVKVADALGDPGTVLLATGTNFPDALTAGVAAVKAGGVVLLTNGSTLPAETSAYLSAHPGTVYAIGGPAATADPSATAIFGADRFDTAVDVATKFFSAPTGVGIATGMSFADALTGGALLGHVTAPLVLVGTSSVPGSVTTYLPSERERHGHHGLPVRWAQHREPVGRGRDQHHPRRVSRRRASPHESQDGLGTSDDDPLAGGQPNVVGFDAIAEQNEMLRFNRDGEPAVGQHAFGAARASDRRRPCLTHEPSKARIRGLRQCESAVMLEPHRAAPACCARAGGDDEAGRRLRFRRHVGWRDCVSGGLVAGMAEVDLVESAQFLAVVGDGFDHRSHLDVLTRPKQFAEVARLMCDKHSRVANGVGVDPDHRLPVEVLGDVRD